MKAWISQLFPETISPDRYTYSPRIQRWIVFNMQGVQSNLFNVVNFLSRCNTLTDPDGLLVCWNVSDFPIILAFLVCLISVR